MRAGLAGKCIVRIMYDGLYYRAYPHLAYLRDGSVSHAEHTQSSLACVFLPDVRTFLVITHYGVVSYRDCLIL
jgi:hypothetical protein